jgi:hypothetical protein
LPADDKRPRAAEFAVARQLDAATLTRWLEYLKDRPHPALATVLATADHQTIEPVSQELEKALADETLRREKLAAGGTTRDSAAQAAINAELLRFRADDRWVRTNDQGRIILWPDRAGIANDAAPAADSRAPIRASAMIHGHSRPIVRFEGQELLQAAGAAPPIGSLFVVFRPDEANVAGQRLVGWEDSSVGQHGLGLIADAKGTVHAILRRNGANGDVVSAGSRSDDFELVSVTWGPHGVTLHRNGVAAGVNKAIDQVSSDAAITALRIGGPGSGAAGKFIGDLAELRVYAEQLDDAARESVEAELNARWFGPPKTDDAPADEIADLRDELLSPRGPFWISEADRLRLLPEDIRTKLTALTAELDTLRKKPAPETPKAVVVQEGGPPGTKHEGFHDAHVFVRGNPANPGPSVPRGFPRVLAGEAQPPIRDGSGRRELAAWLCRPDHPLTARVMVNRIWQHHFGEGLVRTSTNFGLLGERPSHPELLDYLARAFVRSGSSIKAMHRLMMLSNVYQQSTRATDAALAADPENRWLARMSRRRLEAEAIRDGLLAIAGRLDTTPGGPGFLSVATPRRSLYLMSVRTGAKAAEFGPLFDAPDCGAVVERRGVSTVAPQALFLLNDPFVIDLAAALADRVVREVPAVDNDGKGNGDIASRRIEWLYQLAFARAATSDEVEIGLQLLGGDDSGGGFAGNELDAWSRYCHVIFCTNELVYVD